jgi:pimeloyl-ACP methyl ester carboxylesterase
LTAKLYFLNNCAVLLCLLTLVACTSVTITPVLPVPANTAQVPTATSQPPTATPASPSQVIHQKSEIKDCPDSKFTCITLTVPLDHFDPSNTATISVTFGLLRAFGERKGLYVTAVGGPGASGLLSADTYTDEFDPALREHFDLVFFDQRGVGQSGGWQCAEAATQFYQIEFRTETQVQEQALSDAAQHFAAECSHEGRFDLARTQYYNTRQAVEDLEAFRDYLGDSHFWLYGESYGTEFAQTYAAAHPDRLAGLILDGPVDLTLSIEDFLAQQAQAFNDVLLLTLEACQRDLVCRGDLNDNAVQTYDQLVARLKRGPIEFEFTRSDGSTVKRTLTLAQFESAVTYLLYDEQGRVDLLHALVDTQADDYGALALAAYDSLGLDADTLEAYSDPSFSDAAYYAVECNDYAFFGDAPAAQRAEAYLRAGDKVEETVPRLSSVFYGDLPCVFWSSSTEPRPLALKANGIPTLVLGATADPATPVENARSIYRQLADGYLIVKEGGAHVIFGYGEHCPDELVTAFVVEGRRPADRETSCPGDVIFPYTTEQRASR